MSVTLRESLNHEPQVLKFGTSGRRGLVKDLTQLELYLNALAEVRYLQGLSQSEGGIRAGDEFFFAYDLRPSSADLAQAVVRAIRDAGMRPINCGAIPTPALTFYAMSRGKGSIMVTGSHIPFDRNGYKTNTACGELLKHHEGPINEAVALVRAELYGTPADRSLFDASGKLKSGPQPLPDVTDEARNAYIARYATFFAEEPLGGLRLLAYQHSAVGRDLLVEVLTRLGADVTPAGRSETFVPIDTEAIDDTQLAVIQKLVDEAGGNFDAVVSTDGDSDRPLVLAVKPEGQVRFFGGDLLGMVVAEFLGADAVVVPISCNDAIDRGPLAKVLEPKTRIGSPFVIAGMEQARAKGRQAVCGWEANGGFLTGSEIRRSGKSLRALPTRDAMLPILSVLAAARRNGSSLVELFDRLPARYSRASLLRNFPRPVALRILEGFGGEDAKIRLAPFFPASLGFGEIQSIDYTDGVRVNFDNGDVAHLRPSGNADELRIYAVADTQERADAIARLGVAEPDGILRRMERAAGA